MMKNLNMHIVALFLSAAAFAENNYDIINTGLPTAQQISQKSTQIEVNRACNARKTPILAALKKAKAGSPERKKLLADQTKINEACAAVDTPAKRDAYHKSLEGDRQAKKSEKKAEEKKKLEKEIKEDPVLGDVKLPSESDPNFISKLKNVLQGEFKKLAKDADVKIFNLIGNFLSKINIPPAGTKIFNNDFKMRDMKFLVSPTGPNIRTGLGFTGTSQFNKLAVKATVYVVQDTDRKIQFSISMELPDNYKISSLFPKFKKLDVIPIPKGMVVAATFNYTHPAGYEVQDLGAAQGGYQSGQGLQKGGYEVEKGFNFIGSMELTGPLRALGELRKKAKEMDSIVVDFDAPIYMQGVISSMTSATFRGVVPMRLGMDFKKVNKIPKAFSDIINKITTDDIIVEVVIKPTDQTLGGQTGIRIYLGSQPQPVRIQAFGTIDALTGKLNFGGKVPDMIELKWLAVGDFGVELYLDPAVTAVLVLLGIPVSGVGLRGRIDLGKPGDTRASLAMAGKLSLETKKAADFALDVTGKNIQFAELVSLVSKMAAKAGVGKPIPANKIPTMTIKKVKGRVAPYDTVIAGTPVPAGFQLALDAQLFNKTFGFDVDIKHKDLIFKGSGYMSQIVFNKGKSPIFKLSGPGPDKVLNTADDGPIVACSFDAKNPAKASFSINTLLEIPPVNLKNTVDLEISANKFKGDFESTFLGFTTVFGVNIEPTKWQQMYVKFGFKGDFEKFLSKQAKPALEQLKQKAAAKLAEVDKKIGQLAGELNKLKQQQTKAKQAGVSATDKEIAKTRATIKRINAKIAALKKECKTAKWYRKTDVCIRTGAEITAQGTALAGQETYLNTLLKPGKEVIKGSLDALNKINEATQKASTALANAKVFQKAVQGILTGINGAITGVAKGLSIFKVSEAIGSFSAPDLSKGRLPKLESLKAEVNIPQLPKLRVNLKNLQFDFKKPAKSAVDIAKKLVSGVKIG